MNSPDTPLTGTGLYELLDIHDLQRFKLAYQAGFDRAASDATRVIEEAVIVSRLNVEVSEAVALMDRVHT